MQGRERRNKVTEAVQRENEELKEVPLSAVQIVLESKTEVNIRRQYVFITILDVISICRNFSKEQQMLFH